MSYSRRLKRKKEAIGGKLVELLGSFYSFLESQPQPSDEQVRGTFLMHNYKWIETCIKNELGEESKNAFKIEVGKVWEQKKQKRADKI